MKRGIQGHYDTISTVAEMVKAFVPNPLPPTPPLELSGSLQKKLTEASHALGKLDAAAELLPDVGLFLYMFIRNPRFPTCSCSSFKKSQEYHWMMSKRSVITLRR